MNVLVTGAAGVLGSAVARVASTRHNVRATDMLANPHSRADILQADLTDYEQVRRVVRDIDVVVHCAALHPWKQYTDEQYLDSNLKATHQILKASVEAGVRRFIYTSSIAAIGYGPFAESEMPVREDHPSRPMDLYSLTKHLGEEVCRYFNGVAGLPVLCLRPVNFVPYDSLTAGARLLACTWLAAQDVVRAHDLAIDAEFTGVEMAFLAPSSPYTPSDVVESRSDPPRVVDRFYPGVTAFFRSRGIAVSPIRFLFATDRARELLGWEPEVTFQTWYDEARRSLR